MPASCAYVKHPVHPANCYKAAASGHYTCPTSQCKPAYRLLLPSRKQAGCCPPAVKPPAAFAAACIRLPQLRQSATHAPHPQQHHCTSIAPSCCFIRNAFSSRLRAQGWVPVQIQHMKKHTASCQLKRHAFQGSVLLSTCNYDTTTRTAEGGGVRVSRFRAGSPESQLRVAAIRDVISTRPLTSASCCCG
jgi:hypothetical protein